MFHDATYAVALCYRDDVERNWFVCWNAQPVELSDMLPEHAKRVAAYLNDVRHHDEYDEEQYKVIMQPEQMAA